MTQITLGRIEFGPAEGPQKEWDRDRPFYKPPPKVTAQDVFDTAIEQAKREQFVDDCRAICTMCDEPDKWEPTLWNEKLEGYGHKNKKTGEVVWGDCHMLFLYWLESHGEK